MSGIEKLINGELLTKETVAEVHKGLVHRECNKLRSYAKNQGFDYEDIVSIGFIGLLNAFEKFDGVAFDVRFSTYASPMIWGEIQRALRNSNAGIYYGRPTKELAWQIGRLELGDKPAEEIAEQLEISTEKVTHALNYLRHRVPASLDKPLQLNDGEASIADLIGSPDDLTAVYVKEFIASLSSELRTVLEMTMAAKTQFEIAAVIGKSQVQVSRCLKRIGESYISYSQADPSLLKTRTKKRNGKTLKEVNPLIEDKRNLTEEVVDHLREQGYTFQAIADRFGISLPALNTRRQNWKLKRLRSQQETPAPEVEADPKEFLTSEVDRLRSVVREKDGIIDSLRLQIGEINQSDERVPQLESQVRTLTVDLQDERKLLTLLLEREAGRLRRTAEPILH